MYRELGRSGTLGTPDFLLLAYLLRVTCQFVHKMTKAEYVVVQWGPRFEQWKTHDLITSQHSHRSRIGLLEIFG